MTCSYDAIILGGGLVGASCALALAQQGIKVAVVERNKLLHPGKLKPGRAIALNYQSINFLQQLDLDLSAKLNNIDAVEVSFVSGVIKKTITPQTFGASSLGGVIDSNILLHCLQQKLINTKNIKFIASNNYSWNSADNIHTVTATENIKARLLIVADGSQSKLRSQLGVTAFSTETTATAIVTNITLNSYYKHQNIAYQRFSKDKVLALLPINGKQMKLVITGKVIGLDLKQDILNLANNIFMPKLKFNDCEEIVTYPINDIKTNLAVTDNIVLLGNTKNTMHPIAAQGLNLALNDIQLLLKHLELINIDKSLQNFVAESNARHANVDTLVNNLLGFQDKNFLVKNIGLALANTALGKSLLTVLVGF